MSQKGVYYVADCWQMGQPGCGCKCQLDCHDGDGDFREQLPAAVNTAYEEVRDWVIDNLTA